ncbi:histone-binding protein SET3 KNAG_0C01460 [Huiozyma naganishii CBS 8797]|uniref:SET domain-containing protein n=1 Tax=Huiozyma naganishii (strain ATCC MYA-139 / BCRC 22969 / CBS 8797 / KCTC 17520 / NBRC 10181 / NCYC 3082 / Yp74L-3) TaxID=1071383 RepID=J7S4E8_HUIN7|nr:hypothetical protein KNAG_0C01460 [Kazachstania naganishii CBS 8797]CCK69259.1 hypothetical protein KNAG_0C01460 [Kazachstania naganishii CBS 8797]
MESTSNNFGPSERLIEEFSISSVSSNHDGQVSTLAHNDTDTAQDTKTEVAITSAEDTIPNHSQSSDTERIPQQHTDPDIIESATIGESHNVSQDIINVPLADSKEGGASAPQDHELHGTTITDSIQENNKNLSSREAPQEHGTMITTAEDVRTNSASQQDQNSTVSDSYIIDPDAGIITCICGFDDDDGFTIQCDHCYRWQHAACYNIENLEAVPENYLCNVCQPRDLDDKVAKELQLKRRNILLPVTGDLDENLRKKRKTETSTTPDKNRTNSTERKDIKQTPERASANEFIRQKEHLVNAKDAYPATYVPLKKCTYRDNLLELFLKNHRHDDCVIPYPKAQFTPIPTKVKPYADIAYCRTFPGFNKLGVFLKKDCLKNDYICEMVGEVDFRKNYVIDCKNQYSIWGTPKAKVMFHPSWPIYIDQRGSGNSCRYLRRNCDPNVELVTIRLPNNDIKFVYRALNDIEEGEELFVKWQWDKNHPILQMTEDISKFEKMDDKTKYVLIQSVDVILSSCDCGCGNNNKECPLSKAKKCINGLLKTVRSRMNNKYKLNEVLSSLQTSRKKRQPPILTRLLLEAETNQKKNIIYLVNSSMAFKGHNRASWSGLSTENLIPESDNSRGESALEANKLTDSVPFRLKPLKSHHSTEKKRKFFEIGLNYNESDITDLDKLAVPIDIPIDTLDDGTVTANSNIPESASPHTTTIQMRRKSSEGTLDGQHAHNTQTASATETNEVAAPFSIPVSTTPMSEAVSKSKKKLSFADYKKKLNK